MISEKKSGAPYLNVWFGNFYRPAYDDQAFVAEGMELLKKLGFNSVLLDSKDWEDFRERYEGKPASQYVGMQEFMMEQIKKRGLSHTFLAIYLNADNLYPNIRFSPPVFGESVVTAKGNDGRWYRYWSEKAQETMTEHVSQLLEMYGENMTRIEVDGKEKKPLCSMWDPVVAPSFDEDGKKRYRSWLEKRYNGNIKTFNRFYKTEANSFETIEPEQYWFELRYPGKNGFSEKELEDRDEKCRVWMDNQRWKSDELVFYFEAMQKKLHALDPQLYLCPDLSQWGYFLNVDGSFLTGAGLSDLWDTAVRGADFYRIAPYVDAAHFISVPVLPNGDPDCYVTACQHSMMRNMNRGRSFVGGIYWGRFVYNDLYAWISPCEAVASMAASGASGYASYGMCGLDDGGVLHRMPEAFCRSLEEGNRWWKEVVLRLGVRKAAKAAVLFPSAMALAETFDTEHNHDRRLDLLGWYKALEDWQIDVDVVDGSIFKDQTADQYEVLVLAANDCYALDPDSELEQGIAAWVKNGGMLLHGPMDLLAQASVGSHCLSHEKDAFECSGEKGMLTGTQFGSFEEENADVLAVWETDENPAIVKRTFGKGTVCEIGFFYGFEYTGRIAPHVPLTQRNNELYPLTMLKKDPVGMLLEEKFGTTLTRKKGVERAEFENGTVIVNHSSYPCRIDEPGTRYFQNPELYQDLDSKILLPHMGVFIERKV